MTPPRDPKLPAGDASSSRHIIGGILLHPVRNRTCVFYTPVHFDLTRPLKTRANLGCTFASTANAVPRRTRSSTRPTTICRPSKRVGPTEGTPTLALTAVEVEAIVQSAAVASAPPGDPDSHPTVESFRIALGTSSMLEPLASPVGSGAAASPPASAAPAMTLPEASPPAGTRSPPAIAERGPRRTRASLRVAAIKALPPRKR